MADKESLLQSLRALAHLAGVLNSRQHAGLPITPAMWSELYQRTNEANMVACMYAENFYGSDEANRNLIAAAPDMLAALQELTKENFADSYRRGHAWATIAVAKARAAIAKATGGDNG
jgi:hypothetical protein